jgi:putative hydroxymethylpyrimidine transport system substrate-binding protein
MADLKGKTIGYSMSGVGSAILGQMLKYDGVSLKDVTLVDVHYNLVQALLTHRVDAISGIGRNFEVPEMQLAGHPARAFYPELHGIPKFDALIFLANRYHEKDPRLLAFMQAVKEGEQYIQSHPVESWKLLIKHHPELRNKLNRVSWKITEPYFDVTPIKLNKKRYVNFAKWMYKQKLINKVLPLKYYATDLNVLDKPEKK